MHNLELITFKTVLKTELKDIKIQLQKLLNEELARHQATHPRNEEFWERNELLRDLMQLNTDLKRLLK
jgi:hypothetical protein